MIKSVNGTVSVAILAILACLPTPAPAASARVWVSNVGVDSGTCGATATPCRTLQTAHDNASAGGIVSVLTPGDYGPVIITKSLSITNDGSGEAGILNSALVVDFIGLKVDAAKGDVVGVRGLVIDGQIVGDLGIWAHVVGSLHIQNCVVRNFQSAGTFPLGIFFGVFNAASLFADDTLVYNNGSVSNSGGILLNNAGGAIKVVLNRVRLENNVFAFQALGSGGKEAHVTIRDSTVTGNAADGIVAQSVAGANVVVLVKRTTVTNNAGIGLHADGAHGIILVSGAKVSDNGTGVSATNGGQVISYGNNRNNSNIGAEGTATSTFSLF